MQKEINPCFVSSCVPREVYYGAANTHICIATGRVGDLIPESVRQEFEGKSN